MAAALKKNNLMMTGSISSDTYNGEIKRIQQ